VAILTVLLLHSSALAEPQGPQAGAQTPRPAVGTKPRVPAPAPVPAEPQVSDADALVKIQKIEVIGSRLEPHSVQMLTGLRPGQKINETSLRKAIQRMLESGLVKNVDYAYESTSDQPDVVTLDLTITDETPLLPASIQLPDIDAEDVWGYLKGVDTLFTRELPRTQKALQFYTRYIQRYLANQKKSIRVSSVITADNDGNASGIVFVPQDLLGLPQFKNKP
jgi:outer membrane protein assembly factor BamA